MSKYKVTYYDSKGNITLPKNITIKIPIIYDLIRKYANNYDSIRR
ncbi:MAG: hypothetical protein Q4G04_01890 [bacterium]|nr:hypothetical protein [bacterium]